MLFPPINVFLPTLVQSYTTKIQLPLLRFQALTQTVPFALHGTKIVLCIYLGFISLSLGLIDYVIFYIQLIEHSFSAS